MMTFAHAHGVPFAIESSRFMPGRVVFAVGEHPRRLVHSTARAWSLLRRLAGVRPPSPGRPSASLRGAVMGIKIVK